MRDLMGKLRGGAIPLTVVALVLLAGVAFGAGVSSSGKSDGDGERTDQGTARVELVSSMGGGARVAAERGQRGPRGPRGRRGPQGDRGLTGEAGPTGPAGSSDEHVIDIGVDWNGSANAAGHDSATTTISGIGTLTLECPALPADDDSLRRLVLTPATASRRTVATLTTFEGASQSAASNERYASDDGSPIEVPIPRNGMISGNLSLEPSSGGSVAAGGLPVATLTLSSYWKENDPVPADNTCHISAQILSEGD